MTTHVELKPLESHDRQRFTAEMQEAFQTALEQTDEQHPLPVLPAEDIEKSLTHPGAEALVAWSQGQPVGGAIIFPDRTRQEHECALLYVSASAHGQGVGTALWQAIEDYYPEAKAWKLCTPYFERRNVHFYLRKCGFHIVDLFEDTTRGVTCADDERDWMFTFIKRRDGLWAAPTVQ